MLKIYITERSYYGDKHKVDYSYYKRFHKLNSKYFQEKGEGTTMANQLITAINKLVYEYYNNDLVYDNTSSNWKRSCHDDMLCTFANWIYAKYTGLRPTLDKVKAISSDDEYEEILKELTDEIMNEVFLNDQSKKSASDSVYNISTPFKVNT